MRARVKVGARVRARVRVKGRVGRPGLGAHGDAQVKRCGAAGSAQVGVEPLDGSRLDAQVEQALQLGLRPAGDHPYG